MLEAAESEDGSQNEFDPDFGHPTDQLTKYFTTQNKIGKMKKDSASSTSKKTEILIVEDSSTQAAQIKYLLESYNYKVISCQNGKQAMEMAFKA